MVKVTILEFTTLDKIISILTFKLLSILNFNIKIIIMNLLFAFNSSIEFYIIILFIIQSVEKVPFKNNKTDNLLEQMFYFIQNTFFLRRYSDLHCHLMHQTIFLRPFLECL